jgi:hypothetical protein
MTICLDSTRLLTAGPVPSSARLHTLSGLVGGFSWFLLPQAGMLVETTGPLATMVVTVILAEKKT